MASSNFYDELDLRYPEIAICLETIDRTNPGKRKFTIPILTPNLKKDKEEENNIKQNNSFIENEEDVNITDVKVKNYIKINVPKELCAYVGSNQNFKNVGDLKVISSQEHNITANGTVGPPSDYSVLSASGHINTEGIENHHSGVMNHIPIDSERYIAKGSKWIVVFIGGDINKPQIIGRYTDPVVE